MGGLIPLMYSGPSLFIAAMEVKIIPCFNGIL